MGTANSLRRWVAVFLVLLALLFVPRPAAAQTGTPGAPLPVCVLRALPGMTPGALFARPDRFNCTASQRSFGRGDYWVLSAPLPPATGTAWPIRARAASLWQDRLDLYALYADGRTARAAASQRQLSRSMQLGAIIETKFPDRHVAVQRLLWHVKGSANLRGIVIGAQVDSPADSAAFNLWMCAIYSSFAGMGIALLVYNLAMWAALRHRFQLAYCAMVTMLLVYALSSSGALAWGWPGIANNDRMRINYVALAIASTAAIAFAKSFFEPGVFAGWVGRLTGAISLVLVGSGLLFAALAPWHVLLLDRLYTASYLLMMVTIGPVLWRAWRQQSSYLWLFAIAWAAPILLGGLRIAANFGLLPWSFWLDNSTVLSMMTEAMLSSLGIAYRVRMLSKERDHAREQEIAARLLADTDPLTGLLNRRSFLDRAIGRHGDQRLVLVDIDHFKRVNERIGHDGGDDVLRVLARNLRIGLPADALVARIGGEEFAILCSAADFLTASAILSRLRSVRWPLGLAVTASIGTCVGPMTHEDDWIALYRSADRALFDAKAAGRDRAREAAVRVAA